MLEAMVKFTNFNIEEVYKMPAIDFLVYLEYMNEKNRRERIRQFEELERQKSRMRSRR